MCRLFIFVMCVYCRILLHLIPQPQSRCLSTIYLKYFMTRWTQSPTLLSELREQDSTRHVALHSFGQTFKFNNK